MLAGVETRFRQAVGAFKDDDGEQAVDVIRHHPDILMV